METKELQINEAGFIRPLLGVDQAVEAFNQYQTLKMKLRGEGDFVTFVDRNGNVKEAPTKSWRSQLTRFFGISVEILSESMELLTEGSFVVKAIAKAIAPNGLFMIGDGSCWSKTKNEFDKKGNPIDIYHNTRSHAITRAKNRAVLELVGFGEVSAEEISGELETPEESFQKQRKNNVVNKLTSKQRTSILNMLGNFVKRQEGENDAEWEARKMLWFKEKSKSKKDLDKLSIPEASGAIKALEEMIRQSKEKSAKPAEKTEAESQETPEPVTADMSPF